VEILNLIDYFVCPDCLSVGLDVGLRLQNNSVVCPNCSRVFYFKKYFIDLLPKKPRKKFGFPVRSIFKNYYFDQFKISPDQVFVKPKSWGIYENLPLGYRVFLDEEKAILENHYSPFSYLRESFCDVSASNGFFAFSAAKYYKNIFFCDINLEYLNYGMRLSRSLGIKNVFFVRCDMFSFPFRRGKLNAAICTDTFVYYGVKNDLSVIEKIFSSVSKGGVLLFDIHYRRFYVRAKWIYEYSKDDVRFLKCKFNKIKTIGLGRVPTFFTPTRYLFKLFSKLLFFLPPIRLLCILRKV